MLILEDLPVPYRIPLHERLSKNKNLGVRAFFSSDYSMKETSIPGFGGAKTKWINSINFPHKFLKNFYPFKEKPIPRGLWNFGIVLELLFHRPDAILIHGYQSFTNKIALITAKIFRIPVIFRDEIDFIDYSSPLAKKIKKIILPILFEIPSAFLYSYTRSKKFYLSLGIPRRELFFHPCAVNNDLFQDQFRKNIKNKDKFKKEFGIPLNSKIILYVGRLDERKKPLDTLKAYSKMKIKNKTSLVFVGGGKQKKDILKFSTKNKLRNVFVIDFIPREKLYKAYSIADLFAIPSDYDPSPKSMNEAMNFSLPVITSENVGTSRDLVKNGKNGFIIKVGDFKELSEKMEKILSDEKLIKKMGKESLKIISKWNFDEDVKATVKALDYIYKNKNRK